MKNLKISKDRRLQEILILLLILLFCACNSNNGKNKNTAIGNEIPFPGDHPGFINCKDGSPENFSPDVYALFDQLFFDPRKGTNNIANKIIQARPNHWSAQNWVKTLFVMYEITRDKKYFLELERIAEAVSSLRDDKQVPPHLDEIRNRVIKAWTWRQEFTGMKRYSTPTGYGLFNHILTMFSRSVAENPCLYKEHSETAVKYVNEAIESIYDIPENEWWINSDRTEAGLLITPAFANLDCESLTDNEAIQDCKEERTNAIGNEFHPYNKVHAVARVMIDIVYIMGTDMYQNSQNRLSDREYNFYRKWMAERLAQLHNWWINQALHLHEDPRGEYYLWSKQGLGPNDDVRHASFTLDYFAELYRSCYPINRTLSYYNSPLRIEASRTMLERFARTLLYYSSEDGAFHSNIGGGENEDRAQNSSYGWIELTLANPEVYERCQSIITRNVLGPHNYAKLLRNQIYFYAYSPEFIGIDEAGHVWYVPERNTRYLLPHKFTHMITGNFDTDIYSEVAGIDEQGMVWYSPDLVSWRRISHQSSAIVAGDFNSDGTDELAGLGPSGSIWYTTDMQNVITIPGTWEHIVSGDFDGNGRTDLAGLGPTGNIWYISNLSTEVQIPGTWKKIVSGDFDGNGRDDLAGLGPSGKIWYTIDLYHKLNIPGTWDEIVSGDFNGDGETDLAGLGPLPTQGTQVKKIWYTTNKATEVQLPGHLASLYSSNFDGDKLDELGGLDIYGKMLFTTNMQFLTSSPEKFTFFVSGDFK
jgi:hypothetical protein